MWAFIIRVGIEVWAFVYYTYNYKRTPCVDSPIASRTLASALNDGNLQDNTSKLAHTCVKHKPPLPEFTTRFYFRVWNRIREFEEQVRAGGTPKLDGFFAPARRAGNSRSIRLVLPGGGFELLLRSPRTVRRARKGVGTPTQLLINYDSTPAKPGGGFLYGLSSNWPKPDRLQFRCPEGRSPEIPVVL